MTTITVELPEELAEEARRHGLLGAGAVEAMIRETSSACSKRAAGGRGQAGGG